MSLFEEEMALEDAKERVLNKAADLVKERDELKVRAETAEHLISAALADSERRRYEQELFALRDGLSLWKRQAEDAEMRAKESFDRQAVIDEVCDVLIRLSPGSCGTLAERVEHAIKMARQAE